MDVAFRTRKIEKTFNSADALKRVYGARMARVIMTRLAVRTLAEGQGIAPGIVVGMVQHQGLLPWTHLNGLKVRLEWQEAE